jgi:hypothetical protein
MRKPPEDAQARRERAERRATCEDKFVDAEQAAMAG